MRAILGGTGFYRMAGLTPTRRQAVRTPYGLPSGALTFGRIQECSEIVFLNRHGYGHTLAPHLINYRANLWALHEVGVRQIIAVASTGAVRADCAPGSLVLPDQLIDYTAGRAGTFVDATDRPVVHVDMTEPYDAALREELLAAAAACNIPVVDGGTYACTQGPRLETAAEIRRLARDGCDLVGMTSMPEAALARELGIAYTSLCVVSNYAAGVGDSQREIAFDGAQARFEAAMQSVQHLLAAWCQMPDPVQA
ncbi:S-methyl-5'-thioinosine phosphorylase [Achromobacter sp. GG226]|uniref:S-methyl-5'-thioinosine phosphorylase n=1 Tax=Verticiella alkaliphila TaxID=2779529 RepID=UPI001C0D2BC9|nr:S-methyl-5'-thioinosine phosphorylase [Verticiella sp. GG226]MBU4609870.1 S-methyl-5'-thioinosine phosphorylase [Verticiella sp. GG226]